jgi:hypothetical protein
MGPYRRFVRGEGERLREQGKELAATRDALKALRARIEGLTPAEAGKEGRGPEAGKTRPGSA